MIHLRVFFTLALFFSCFSIFAQQQEAFPEVKKTLTEQFQELEQQSGNYRANGISYEVVQVTHLNTLKSSVFDSLATARASINKLSATIIAHTTEIKALTAKLKETTQLLNAVTEKKDHIAFLGIVVSKSTYNLILWSIIAALVLLLLFFIYKFRNSNALTQQARATLADLEKEYEAHKRRALEREQKISRQLQDELNKNKKQ